MYVQVIEGMLCIEVVHNTLHIGYKTKCEFIAKLSCIGWTLTFPDRKHTTCNSLPLSYAQNFTVKFQTFNCLTFPCRKSL